MPQDNTHLNATQTRRKPGIRWYVLSAVMLVASVSVFALTVRSQIKLLHDKVEPMPRFVGPTSDAGVVITIDQPGKQNIFYENKGEFEGTSFSTPRRQVWTTFQSPSMTCVVTNEETGKALEVRLPGTSDAESKSKTSKDQVLTYDLAGMQGHSAWVFDVDSPGEYRIVMKYVEAVSLEPGDIAIPDELTKADKRKLTQEQGEAQEAERREAIERAALAELEPIDVLFAVGPDPTSGAYFEVIGLKGAAGVLAFGFTFSVLITLVTFMLRNGHITPRGELTDVKRGVPGAH